MQNDYSSVKKPGESESELRFAKSEIYWHFLGQNTKKYDFQKMPKFYIITKNEKIFKRAHSYYSWLLIYKFWPSQWVVTLPYI